MPQLHDRTRRKICIAAFFAVCIMPMCCLLAWGLSRSGPWHISAHARRLENCLGLAVSIDDVEHPRPGVVRYVGVRLCDPETGEIVATFHCLEARRQDVKDRPRPALVLVADSARIRPERFDILPRLLHRVMARRMTRHDIDLRLVIGELKIQDGNNIVGEKNTGKNTTTLRAVQGSLQTGHDGAQAEFNFRLDSSSDSTNQVDPVRIRIRRDRRTTPPALCFDIDSRVTELPCDLLSLLIPQCKSLGPHSRFQGYLCAEQTTDGWQGRIKDVCLNGIDLARFCGSHFPNTLTGQAQVTIHRASFTAGRLQKAAGSIAAGPGTIGREFYDSLWRQLRLRYRSLPPDGNDNIPYDKLALNFTINHDGLQINGTVPKQIQPVILANSVESLLGEPQVQPQPISALLDALVPQSSYQVPATKQIQWLSRRLPLPKEGQPAQR